MSLPKFTIIAAVDEKLGIARDGVIPWKCKEGMTHFRITTTGSGSNAVIMGRRTFESMGKALPNRLNIVLSRSKVFDNVIICDSLISALSKSNSADNVYIIGGEEIYREASEKFGYLCKRLLITRIDGDYDCDKFFPYNFEKLDIISSKPIDGGVIMEYDYKITHQEFIYHNIMRELLKESSRENRTNVETHSKFGVYLEFDISKEFPLFTSKWVYFKGVLEELLFFISGKTDTKILEEKGVKIWQGNTRKSVLESLGLDYEEGEAGPIYGFQWRHFGADYPRTEKGFDQLNAVINSISSNPTNRRHVITAWNPTQLHLMALPPCHLLYQFYANDKKLDCLVFMRSCDMFLGFPFNLASYSLLTYIIASICNLKPGRVIFTIGDAHIYSNHIEQTKLLLSRTPLPWPEVEINSVTKIDDIKSEDIKLKNYVSWPAIKAEMAV